MEVNPERIQVIHVPEQQRFEIRVEQFVAELTYTLHGDTITFTHTGVPAEMEGQGIGSKLARTALEYARANGLKIRSLCSFVSAYLKRHPEYQTD